MRWNATCTLVAKSFESDDEGVQTPDEDPTVVFCNERTVGATTWQFYHEAGTSDIAQIELRSQEYDGQREVEYVGKRFTVEAVQRLGDLTVLTLRRQLSDLQDIEQDGGDGNG